MIEILKDALARIKVPGQWCQNGLARNAEGNLVQPESASAVSFCAVGSVYKSLEDHGLLAGTRVFRLLEDTTRRLYLVDTIADANDTLGLDAMVKIFEAAIEEVG